MFERATEEGEEEVDDGESDDGADVAVDDVDGLDDEFVEELVVVCTMTPSPTIGVTVEGSTLI